MASEFEFETDAPPAPRRRLSGAARGWIIAGSIVLVLVILAVVADSVVRRVADATIETQIANALPEGVTGDVHAEVGGFSVLSQLLTGRAEEVRLSAPKLVVDGAPIAVDVVARDIPISLGGTTGPIDATVRIDQDSLNTLAFSQGVPGGFTLGDGKVGYRGQIEVLGFPIAYSATAQPEAAGDSVLLHPTAVEFGSGDAAFDLSGVTNAILGGDPLKICIADRLPTGVEVSGIGVEPGTAVVHLESTGLVLDPARLRETGTCP